MHENEGMERQDRKPENERYRLKKTDSWRDRSSGKMSGKKMQESSQLHNFSLVLFQNSAISEFL
jgi:hypothetical protein